MYYIKNKDNVIGAFEWAGYEQAPRATLTDDNGLPWFIVKNLNAWLNSRTPPKHRENMERLFDQCGLTGTKSVLDYSKGLSLSDSLWVTSDPALEWQDVNLFNNEFDEVISHIAFDGGLQGLQFSTTSIPSISPEFATDGALRKCWVRQDGKIKLKKAGTYGAMNAGCEPYSECMVSQILDRLAYSHVSYSVENFRGRVVSSCDLMTSPSAMLLPIYMYQDFTTFADILDKCKELGILNKFYEHMIIDYLTCNTDRHLGNFGVILNADTYELVSMAPIYDNGFGMLPMWVETDSIQDYIKKLHTPFDVDFDATAELAKQALGTHRVERLIDFKFDRSKLLNFPDSRIDRLEAFLQERVKRYLDMKI